MLRTALASAGALHVNTNRWGVVLEYELPLEGGRRPDAIILAGNTLFVIEFKETPALSLAHADQVKAYARDLADYHSASRDLPVVAVLASSAGRLQRQSFADLRCVGTPEQLADVLAAEAAGDQPDLETWLEGDYAPLPTIIDAARTIFQHEPLPRIWAAESAGVNDTVDLVQELASQAEREDRRLLILVAGVPGSGKTLAGLRTVYEHHGSGAPATFLSGNGPLVAVLQDALNSTVFVKDLHKAILAYGSRGQTPKQNVIVLDEAQRAWDREKMAAQRQVNRSEPEILIDAGGRIPGWCALVGLVGDGQEIHGGEEGGLGQWSDAIADDSHDWLICCPPRLSHNFKGLDVREFEQLDLTRSLRSRRAERLHSWVSRLLGEELEIAADIASEMGRNVYPLRLFRDIGFARDYVRTRYLGEPDRLYGLLSSSHAKNLAALGIDNTFQATRAVRVARWFNDPPDSKDSACQMQQPITEFMCQGLELDLPIVCWGSDFLWRDGRWSITPVRRRFPLKDPEQIVRNTYRVLMTRGRDGLVLFVPPAASFDGTAQALVAAGVDEVTAQSSTAAPLPTEVAR